MIVRLGRASGPGWVKVTVPEFGFVDSVAFAVQPGGAAPVVLGGASISPDGSKLAYVAQAGSGSELRVLDLGSGRLEVIGRGAGSPRWSADGTRLVYLTSGSGADSYSIDGRVTVANADGSNRRVLATQPFSPGLSWSPDGKWVIGRDAAAYRLRVIRMSDGASVPLRLPADSYQPDWR